MNLREIKNYNILCLTALEIFSRAAEPCSLLPTILLASIHVGFWVTVIDRKFPSFEIAWSFQRKFQEKVSESFTKFQKVSRKLENVIIMLYFWRDMAITNILFRKFPRYQIWHETSREVSWKLPEKVSWKLPEKVSLETFLL